MSMPDLAPGAPSRVVDIDVTVLTEDAPMSGWVRFSIAGDLRVPGSGTIIGASSRTVQLARGKGQIRLPAASSAVVDDAGDAWVIIVQKSWLSQPYGIRVPAGTSPVNLADLAPARPLTRRETQWALTSASLSVQTVASDQPAGGSVTLTGGTLAFALRVPQGPPGLPGPGATAADDAVATYIKTPTSKTSIALADRVGGTYSPRQWGVVGDGQVDDTAAWNRALAQAPAGATVVCPPGDVYKVTAPVNLPRAVTLRGGDWRPTHSDETFRLQSSGVRLESMSITAVTGTGHSPHKIIYALGTQAAPYRDLVVRDVKIKNSRHAGVWLHYCEDSILEDVTIDSPAYVGIMLNSVSRITVNRARVLNVLQLDYSQSYGISVTDSTNDEAGRSRDVLVTDSLVDGCKWEGVSTHSALRLQVIGNTLRNCYSGIAVLSGNTSRVVPPHDAVVVGNTIARAAAATGEAAIKFLGSQSTEARPATGTISGNTITGYGTGKPPINVFNVDRSSFTCAGNSVPEVPWSPISLSGGWRDGTEVAEYSVDANTLRLRGIPTKTAATTGSLNTIGSVPAYHAPRVTRYLGSSKSFAQNNDALVRITDAGLLQLQAETNPSAAGGYHPINFTVPLT